jgi:hypothetical protein
MKLIVVLTMLEVECKPAYDLFVGSFLQRSTCSMCNEFTVKENILTLPTICCPAESGFDFVDTLRDIMIQPEAESQNLCGTCKVRTTHVVTQKVQRLPVVGMVPMHRKYLLTDPKTKLKTLHKSAAVMRSAKNDFTLKDAFNEVICTPQVVKGPSKVIMWPTSRNQHRMCFVSTITTCR